MSAYLIFELKEDGGDAYVKPAEIVSFSNGSRGGSRIVTRQNQVYYVEETLIKIDSMIKDFFIDRDYD